jgi:hypothetical protein
MDLLLGMVLMDILLILHLDIVRISIMVEAPMVVVDLRIMGLEVEVEVVVVVVEAVAVDLGMMLL